VQANHLAEEVAGAILDGTPVDWPSAESRADEGRRPVIRQLKVLAALADVHRDRTRTETLPPPVWPAPPVDAPLERWGHLRILERIGRGAYGQVYRAWDERLDREVALKLIPSHRASPAGVRSQFIHEGRLLARVRHPNVVTIYGAEQDDDTIGLWMEYVHGRTLEQLLIGGREFSARDAADIGFQLCAAVSAVHHAGLLHRDIKSHNVMLADDGRVVLMDFGTGREFDDDSQRDMSGTPLFLAPEVLRGETATVQSDIYSLGVLLFHLVTQSYPVRGQTMHELRAAHDRNDRADLRSIRPDLPAKLVRVIDRASDPQLTGRYASAAALASDLKSLGPHSPVARWLRPVAAAAAIALIGVVGWEVGARQTGSATRPSALLSRVWQAPVSPASRAANSPVIAVLPFQNLSREAGSAELADGMTVGLIQQLAVIDGLRVNSQMSSFMFKDRREIAVASVAQQLGATLVLEGSAQFSGDLLRVNAQLVRPDNDVLWSDHFDRQITSSREIFAVQDDIARAIVNALRLKLGRGQRRYDADLPLDVYSEFIRAQRLQERRGSKSSTESAVLFQGIVDRYPKFAPAWAGLAGALAEAIRMSNPDVGLASDQDVARVRAAAIKAIDLDPRLAEAQAALGAVLSSERDWPQAEAAFERALALNPSRTITHTEYVVSTLMPQGKSDEALRQLANALAIDPLSLDVRRTMANVQLDSGQYDAAIENCRLLRSQAPGFPFVEKCLGRALSLSGQHEAALAIVQQDPDDWGMLGYVYGVMGRRAEAEAIADSHPDAPGRRALIYAGLGDKDRAFAELQRMVELNWWLALYQLQRPEFALLHGDARAAALRQQLGLSPLKPRVTVK